MQELPDIRAFFKPVQPTVSNAVDGVSYTEQFPDHKLSRFIYCYWQLRTSKPLTEDFYYRVVADGCIDIFIDVNQPADNFVMGLSTAYTEFDLNTYFNYAGIRFLPAAFPLIYNINASDDLSRLIKPGSSLQELAIVFDRYFLSALSAINFKMDSRLLNAVELFVKNSGAVNIESGINTGLSPRQLRRLFHFYIGESPKMFSRIVRFQQLLHSKPSVQSLRKNKLFYDAGYYDQAHFIKEFKTLFGITPSKAFEP
jgi:hypothetical protein